jgi:LAO/AO transport system kinase
VRDPQIIAAKLCEGDRLALSRSISWAENGDPGFPVVLAGIWERVGHARRLGITGPPGAGKSTLVNELARHLREAGRTVGILAIDPSSPFSGGALLGDRIRMEDRTKDAGVFIRSMASRDSHGGLARASVDACDVMDAYGFDDILIETVGVGQAEYDIVGAADTVLVVLCPGGGDGIQAMKAGLLEVADVLVVNKSDLPGADRLQSDLEEATHTRNIRTDGWDVPVVGISAAKNEGLPQLLSAIAMHRKHLEKVGLTTVRLEKRAAQVRRVVGERLDEAMWGPDGLSDRVVKDLESGATAYDVAGGILKDVKSGMLSSSTLDSETKVAR